MKKKRIIIIAISLVAVIILSFLVGTGFTKRVDVVLLDYSVSDDGTKLTFNTAITSSIGYTRGFKDKGGGVSPPKLVFYSSFGGLNSSLGAKSKFESLVRMILKSISIVQAAGMSSCCKKILIQENGKNRKIDYDCQHTKL